LKNHFELFGFTPAYALDLARLDGAYRDIQARIHPDRFAHAGDAARRASMQMATQVNEAYRTLKSPVRRAVYLLELNGIDVAFETDTAMPKEFLMEQLEMRERLEAAKDSRSLDVLKGDLSSFKRDLEKQLVQEIDSRKNFEGARTLVRKLMFFDRLAEEVEDAYESF
jgi:molecular chaperone HscB